MNKIKNMLASAAEMIRSHWKISLTVLVLLVLTAAATVSLVLLLNNDDTDNGEPPVSDNGSSDEPAYTYPVVKIIAPDGNPPEKTMIVKLFDESGKQITMATTNSEGVAEIKNAPLGNYTFEIDSTVSSYSFEYDKDSCKLTELLPYVEIQLLNKLGSETISIYGPGAGDDGEGTAIVVNPGTYSLNVKEGMNFFSVQPKTDGIYKIEFENEIGATVGNYGGYMYVQDRDISESDGKGFSIEVSPLLGAASEYTNFVVGINAPSAGKGFLKVIRTGDVPPRIEYQNWIEKDTELQLTPYTAPADMVFESLDITDPTLNVVLGSDGYYHYGTENGPVVLILINKPSSYVDSFYDMCQGDSFGWYRYDENGVAVDKVNYNAMIASYAENCDKELGVYPLTEELAYVIQNIGEYRGWWDFARPNSGQIFGDDSARVVKELAWLFACGIMVNP